jgi:phosphatidylglycerol:prolipoprotein diacylglycerol transferase
VSQLLSFILFVGGIAVFIWRRKKVSNLKDYNRSRGENEYLL